MKKQIVNVETSEMVEIDFTQNDLKQVEKDLAENDALAQKELELATAKAALLEKLGISQEEAQILLS